MRHGVIGFVVAALIVMTGCSTGGASSSASTSGFPERTTTVATIEVRAQPTQLDGGGASFAITLDTHSGALDADLPGTSRLEVNGTAWPAAGWDGDPPVGHHRKGTLRFSAAGPVNGTATLTIGGLPQPVTFSWDSKAGT